MGLFTLTPPLVHSSTATRMIFIKFRYYSKLLYVSTNPDWWLFICLSSLIPCHPWHTPCSSYSTLHKLSYLEYSACLAHAVYFWECLLILPFPHHWADSPLIHQNSAQISPPPGSLLGLTPQSTLDAANAHGVLITFNKNSLLIWISWVYLQDLVQN